MTFIARPVQLSLSFTDRDMAMADMAQHGAGRRISPWRIVGWGFAAFIILLPLVAMQFTDEVNWNGADFIFAGILLGGTGLLFELAARKSPNNAYRAGAAAAIANAFLLVWITGAVGVIGDEGDPANLFLLGLIPLAMAGAAVARFRPAVMAVVMAACAAATVLIGGYGLTVDFKGGVLTWGFAGVWLLAAGLFRVAARFQAQD
jgi:hypothetical protein